MFLGCVNLTNITIPNGVTDIGIFAFSKCSSLKNIIIPENVINIKQDTFSECSSLESVTIPNNVTSIGIRAFMECSSLTNISISNAVESIGDEAFYKCSSLKNITIPNSVTKIGRSAFYECKDLADIQISNNVTSIGDYAFADCKGPIICNTNSKIHEYAESKGIPYILLDNIETDIGEEYKVNKEETWDISKNGDGSIIAKWTLEDKKITISGIGNMKEGNSSDYVFCPKKYTKLVEKIVINLGITSIGEFLDCCNLKEIDIPNSVTRIGYGAFRECDSLKYINVEENNLNYISVNGILYSKDMTEIITIPATKELIINI